MTEIKERSRRGRYRIVDPFFRFYFRFIWPRMADISLGRFDRILDEVEAQWPAHRGAVFEDLALQHTRKALGTSYGSIGRFWSRRGDEVDILLIDHEGRKAMMIESKASNLSPGEAISILNRLEAKWPLVPLVGYQHSVGLICISVQLDGRWPEQGTVITLDDLRK